MKYQKSEFQQTGAVVRLKFLNFMQYSDTEFMLGPNLNVIIGPNGSGKSTIVNGICISLAGKLSVLGRATNLAEYVLVGKEEAMIEIELFNNDGKNLVINRNWNISGKNEWRIDGKKVSEKEVKERVAKLRIQVDNLCQFLPQDKVHDFARLNNKGLLDSTVDAVGNTDLKEKHLELKELQRELNEGEDVHTRKIKILEEKTSQCEKMEEDVKTFEEKRRLLEKIEMLGKKRLWSSFNDSRRACVKVKQSFEETKRNVEKGEGTLNPLKAEVAGLKKKIEKANAAQVSDGEIIKECTNKAKFHSERIEGFERTLEDLQDQAHAVLRREKEKVANIEKYQRTIRELETEIAESGEDATLRPRLEQAKRNTQDALQKLEAEKQNLANKRYETRNKIEEQRRIEGDQRLLNSADNRKMEILREKSSQAYEAVKWLRANKDKYRGAVYEPFIVCANVINPEYAIYIENSINLRDLTIFFFEDMEDMNAFLNQTRVVMKLERVGAAQLLQHDSSNFVPLVPAEQLAKYGLVSYLKDMVQAPDLVLAYMCQQYKLHNTAAFHASAEKHNDVISEHFKISKYFFGAKCQTVSRSNYSGKTSTRTEEVRSHQTLGTSLDQEKIRRINRDMEEIQAAIKNLEIDTNSLEMNCKHLSAELEGRRREHRDLEQRKDLVARNTAHIENQRRYLREAMSKEEEERDKEKITAEKKKILSSMVKSCELLQQSILSSGKARIQKDLKGLQVIPLQKDLEDKELRISSLREEMKEMRTELEVKEKLLHEHQESMLNALKEAKKGTGLARGSKDRPPGEIEEYWEKEGFPDGVDAIDRLSGQLDAQASCTDNVDQSILEQYTALKEQISELEQDIQKRSKAKQNQAKRIEKVKEEWLASLNNLIHEINSRFSRFFRIMGFAGAVELHQGSHDNDFDNYGIKILVKYRDTEPLQELTPHHQSGGERSVATAIYMLSLQALTTVPFRCVDEINQGMDARNERLVFELLVETSCRENNAQYFLLTPKLLTGLEYNPRMNVLIVHNGQEMLHHSQWDLDSIYNNLRSN